MTVTRPKEYISQIHQEMYQLQQSGSLTDFSLNVCGQSIPCHKLVLASVSPYFAAMFRSDMKECQKNETSLENVDIDTAKIIIEYMYTGNISCEYTYARRVLETAEFLQLALIKEKCGEYLVEELNANNCLGLCKTGMMFGLADLVEEAKSMMHDSFARVVESDEFKQLTLAELIDYITEETNILVNQDSLIQACIEWIKFSMSERRAHVVDILKHANIDRCSYEFMDAMRTQNADIINEDVEQLIAVTIYKKNIQRVTRKTVNVDNSYIILLGNNLNEDYPQPYAYGIDEDSWTTLSKAPSSVAKTKYSVCKATDGLIVTGGKGAVKQCHMFAPKYNSWMRLADMECGRFFHGSESVGNLVYVMGGKDEYSDFTDEVLVLNLDDNNWAHLSPMLHPCGIPIITKHEMSIYVIVNTCSLNVEIRKEHGIDMQIYNTVKDTWTSGGLLPDTIKMTFGCRAIGFKDAIYLLGGIAKLCCAYNIEAETWVNLTPPPQIQNYAGTVCIGSTIRLYGGSTDGNHSQFTDNIMEYDTENDEWDISDETCEEEATLCFACAIYKR